MKKRVSYLENRSEKNVQNKIEKKGKKVEKSIKGKKDMENFLMNLCVIGVPEERKNGPEKQLTVEFSKTSKSNQATDSEH